MNSSHPQLPSLPFKETCILEKRQQSGEWSITDGTWVTLAIIFLYTSITHLFNGTNNSDLKGLQESNEITYAKHLVPGASYSFGRCWFTLFFHFHALEKEMATHSSVLAWRIPGMGEPGGLLSLGSHRVGHD